MDETVDTKASLLKLRRCGQCETVEKLSLLALDVKGIRVGPVPPAFITPNVFKILQERFDLKVTEASPPAELVQLSP